MDTREKERKSRPRPAAGRKAPAGRKPVKATAAPQKRAAGAKTNPKRRPPKKPETDRVTPDVVYLPAQRFSRSRLILQLLTVTAVVAALLLGVSVFFKVDTVVVSGSNKYSEWDIKQASGIEAGDHLLTLGRAEAAAKIFAKLPYVESARIGIKLPDTVMIEIVEIEVTYAIKAVEGGWWLVSAGGKIVEKAADGEQESHTKILGVELENPVPCEVAQAHQTAPGTDAQGNPIPITVTQAQRLTTALNIADYLELNGLIGKAASVDVTNMGDIQLWYGSQYQVKLGDNTQLNYKISLLKSTVETLDAHESGVLDITLTREDNKVVYDRFD